MSPDDPKSWEPLAILISKRVANKLGMHKKDSRRDDLFQAAMFGAFTCVKYYNGTTAFKTLAQHRMLGACKDWWMYESDPNGWIKWRNRKDKMPNTVCCSFATKRKAYYNYDVTDKNLTNLISIANPCLHSFDDSSDIIEVLSNLDNNMIHQCIFVKYYRGYTLAELAKEYKLDQSRISQILTKIRLMIAKLGPKQVSNITGIYIADDVGVVSLENFDDPDQAQQIATSLRITQFNGKYRFSDAEIIRHRLLEYKRSSKIRSKARKS